MPFLSFYVLSAVRCKMHLSSTGKKMLHPRSSVLRPRPVDLPPPSPLMLYLFPLFFADPAQFCCLFCGRDCCLVPFKYSQASINHSRLCWIFRQFLLLPAVCYLLASVASPACPPVGMICSLWPHFASFLLPFFVSFSILRHINKIVAKVPLRLVFSSHSLIWFGVRNQMEN